MKNTVLRRVLSCTLTLCMILTVIPFMPRSEAYAYDPSSPIKYVEAGEWYDIMRQFYSYNSRDVLADPISIVSQTSIDAYVKLTKDITYEVGEVVHNSGMTWAVVLGDIVSGGLMEILWNEVDMKRPLYKDDLGQETWTAGRDVNGFLYVGKNYAQGEANTVKVLDLNGHDLVLKYPNMLCRSAVMFDVEGDLYITDSVGGGKIFLDGYITAPDDYDYFKNKIDGDQQRDIFYVHNGGRLFINGGTIECGRGKTEAGFCVFNARTRDGHGSYTGSASRYVNGTAINIADGGEVIINGGTITGRGYEYIADGYESKSDSRNAVIEMNGGKLTINGGTLYAQGGANVLKAEGSSEVEINAGHFKLHKNDNLFCGDEYNGDGKWYHIENHTTYGSYGIHPDMFFNAAHTNVTYGKNSITGNDIDSLYVWDVDTPTSIDICPRGLLYNMTISNPIKDAETVPHLDPTIADHMVFTLKCVDRKGVEYHSGGAWHGEFGDFFGYTDADGGFQRWDLYPDDLPWPSGRHPDMTVTSSDITYKVELLDSTGNPVEFKVGKNTRSSAVISGNSYNNPACVVQLANTELYGDLIGRLKDGEMYTLLVTMTEKFYGTNKSKYEWTVESAAGRSFYIEEKQTPPTVMLRNSDTIIVENKGDSAKLTAWCKNASEVWWLIKTDKGSGSGAEGENSYTGTRIESVLTLGIDEPMNIVCVASNGAGTKTSGTVRVSYKPSFIKTEDTSTTAFKDLWLTLTQPLDLNEYKSVTWYRKYTGPSGKTVEIQYVDGTNNDTCIVNGTTLKLKQNEASGVEGTYYCVVVPLDGSSGKRSKNIEVTFSSDTPDRNITTVDLMADGLFADLCIGDEVPVDPSVLSCEDPRVVIKSITWNNGTYKDPDTGKLYINSPYPSCTIVLGRPEGSNFWYFRSAPGNNDFPFTLDGVSHTRTGVFSSVPPNNGIDGISLYVGYDNHTALTYPQDTLTWYPENIRVAKGAQLSRDLQFTVETNPRFLAAGFGETVIQSVEPYTGQNALPAGLSLTKVGGAYRISGTVTAEPGVYDTLFSVKTNSPDSSTAEKDAHIKFYVMPDGEAALEAAEEQAACFHYFGDWIDDENGETHTRVCSECLAEEIAEHVWDDGEVIVPAMEGEPGIRRHKCIECEAETEMEYVPESCLVYFHYNNGTEDHGTIEVYVGARIGLPAWNSNLAVPSGKSFAGWSEDKSGGTILAAGSAFNVTGETHLYAQWVDAGAMTLLGDVNLDEAVDVSDLTTLARHLARIEILEEGSANLKNADVTNDKAVNVEDLTKLARYLARIILTLD